MSQTSFLFGVHSHQPVDNFDHVVEYAIEQSYRPFFETMANFPQVKTAVHFSGWLFEFIKRHDPKLFALIKKCNDVGSLEFFTGGFYEPVLAAISSRDRRAQIKMLNDFLYDNFGAKPKGLWLTERVWESAVIPDLVECGVEYAIVDDYHFIAAGIEKTNLNGHWLTEHDGCKLALFPIDKGLRYTVPFRPAAKVVESLENHKGAAILFDDGEKFGLWPKTNEWVYGKGWLKEFCELLTASETVKSMHFKEYIDSNKPLGLAYLPTVSYYEMGEWSLPCHSALKLESLRERLHQDGMDDGLDSFVKGGVWKNFFAKYPESNHIHKRTVALSQRVHQSGCEAASDALYRSQTNDALWHGVFGGLYLPCLRDAAYRYIVKCEKTLDISNAPDSTRGDFNFDGYDEVRLHSDELVCIFGTRDGGKLLELDDRAALFNYQSTLARRKELYHEKILNPQLRHESSDEGIDSIHSMNMEKTEELKHLLHFDWYTKNSFTDLIVGENFCSQTFSQNDFAEYGDFADQPFEITQATQNSCVLKREGGIYKNGEKQPTTLSKSFTLNGDAIEFAAEVDTTNEALLLDSLFYVCELNLHFAEPQKTLFNADVLTDFLEFEGDRLTINDDGMSRKITITVDGSCLWTLFWLNTVSQSENGFDVTTQGVCIAMRLPLQTKTTLSGKITIQKTV